MIRRSLRKVSLTAAAAVAAMTGAVLAGPGVAHANGPQVRISPNSNPFLYLDVSGGSKDNGAGIIQWTLSGDNQVFTLQPSGSHFELVNKNSNKCITTDGVAGHQLYQFTCVGASQQLWDTDLTPGFSAYSIQSVYSNLYMDVNGGSSSRGAAIDTWYWNGGQNQYFGAYQG